MNDITFVGRHTTVFSVALHAHDSWEFIYCTAGSGAFIFGDRVLPYKKGDVVIIPPDVPHSNDSQQGFNNIHINMVSPILSLKEPCLVADDSNLFLYNAFNAAFYHFYSDRKERAAFLSAYGNLISYYLIAYQTGSGRPGVVAEIERHIINHYANCDYKLDDYLDTLPSSRDYLRKLFQKEYGVTPHQYLVNKRLQIAAETLANCADPVADIAVMCGFRDPLYFSRMFKRKYGVSPSQHRRCRPDGSQSLPEEEDDLD